MAFLFYLDQMNYISVNGQLRSSEEPALLASSRGYRYGDGLFETMKMYKGKLLLQDLHFERLFKSLYLLKIKIPAFFTTTKLEGHIAELGSKNNCSQLGRVRLSVSRGNGGLYDEDKSLQYIIECWPLDNTFNQLNVNGLTVDIFPDARKSCDIFSNLKSSSFQPYSMAAVFAKENKLNDCLVLNSKGNIADSTTANVFLVRNDQVITTPLSEGCIDGVMRRYLLDQLQAAGYKVAEAVLKENDLRKAGEVFLTNAIKGIRWVQRFRDITYANNLTTEIYNRFIKTLFD
ncbi:MAG TPA: aminotransferase class IV [Chitinophagaceae bacterium]|nr:aminotransferase class IV [Chitinophagaceae bacterium]